MFPELKNRIAARQARVAAIGLGHVGLPLTLLYTDQRFSLSQAASTESASDRNDVVHNCRKAGLSPPMPVRLEVVFSPKHCHTFNSCFAEPIKHSSQT
jgi:hypothetical protein